MWITFPEKSQMKITSLKIQKTWISNSYLIRQSHHGGSLEITRTVPLKNYLFRKFEFDFEAWSPCWGARGSSNLLKIICKKYLFRVLDFLSIRKYLYILKNNCCLKGFYKKYISSSNTSVYESVNGSRTLGLSVKIFGTLETSVVVDRVELLGVVAAWVVVGGVVVEVLVDALGKLERVFAWAL